MGIPRSLTATFSSALERTGRQGAWGIEFRDKNVFSRSRF
jgi:hypothetical protein